MREKILDVLKLNNRKMNPKEILDQIKEKNTIEDLRNITDELNSMCSDGILRTTTANSYFFNDMITGVLDVHDKGSAHVLMDEGKDIFIRRDNLKGACDKDTVAISIINEKTNEGKVVKILKRSLGRSYGEVVDDNGIIKIELFNDNLPYEIEFENSENINLVDGELVHFEYVKDLGKNRVLARVDKVLGHKNALLNEGQTPSRLAEGIVRIACEFNRPFEIPKDALEEADLFPSELDPKEVKELIKTGKRTDLRGETITTTDGKDTKDIDDAVNTIILPNGNFEETTAIADVSHYVKYGSAIWAYAELKGNSDYWINKVAPMLPVKLSNGICSLNPNEDRYSLTVQYELDHAGNIINPRVFKAVIKSKKKMNYDAVQDIIDGKDTEDTEEYTTIEYTVKADETIDDIAFKYAMTSDELLEMTHKGKKVTINNEEDFELGNEVNIPIRKVINNLYVSSKIQGNALRRKGKTDFQSSEPKYDVNDDDKIIEVGGRVQREAECIIENKMLYANIAFTMFMTKELSKITSGMIPYVFRTHGKPNPEKIKEFTNMLEAYGIKLPMHIDPDNVTSEQIEEILLYLKDEKNYSAFSDKLLRCMQKARYTRENIGHFGIGVKEGDPGYTHFTSPIRRMCDLLVHTLYTVFCEEKCRDTKTLAFWGDYLNKMCDVITECEIVTDKCEFAVHDFANALYLEDKLGTTFEGVVDNIMPGYFFVKTDNCIDGRVDYFLNENETDEVIALDNLNEIYSYVEEHKKVLNGFYDYNEKSYGFSRNGRMLLRYGDRVLVCCTGADPDAREIDFTLLRKL